MVAESACRVVRVEETVSTATVSVAIRIFLLPAPPGDGGHAEALTQFPPSLLGCIAQTGVTGRP